MKGGRKRAYVVVFVEEEGAQLVNGQDALAIDPRVEHVLDVKECRAEHGPGLNHLCENDKH